MSKRISEVIKGREEVYCISNQTTVAEAARYLRDRGIRATGVCNLSGKIVGVVSQSDISDKVVAENFRPSEIMVQAIASTGLIKVSPDIACDDAMKIMHERKVYHLIVEDESGNFLGMVSMRDCVNLKAEDEKERADFYRHYAFPSY
ncbi:MAG TPA: CBS domain-containing protein [Blastocatellia bacterium]|nr:CBS domain-containing protein [Blastocatellia bacterium]